MDPLRRAKQVPTAGGAADVTAGEAADVTASEAADVTPGEAASPPVRASQSAVTGVTLITIGSMVANIGSYALHLVASRWLREVGYGEFASLLAAQLVIAAAALALQTVVARQVVRGTDTARLRELGRRCALIVAAIALLLTPLASSVLDTGMLSALAALMTAPILVLLSTEQGLLQGWGRFAELSLLLAGAGLARVIPAVCVLAAGGGPAWALTAAALGTAAAAIAGRWQTGRVDSGTRHQELAAQVGVSAVLRASAVQLVLIAFTSMDLVVARAVLDSAEAGRYALGAVAAKAAFWLPQAVGVVLYPRMANPKHSARAVRSALAVLIGLGAVLVVGAALAAPLVPVLVGDGYAPVAGLLWAFALHGGCLAVLQGALLAAIARDRTGLSVIAWVGLAAEVTSMLILPNTMAELLATALTWAALTTVAVTVVALQAIYSDRASG